MGRAQASYFWKASWLMSRGKKEGSQTSPWSRQASVQAPPSGSQPGPEGARWGPGPRGQAGVAGPLKVGGIGGQDEGAPWGLRPWQGRAWGCTEVLPGRKQGEKGKWTQVLPAGTWPCP